MGNVCCGCWGVRSRQMIMKDGRFAHGGCRPQWHGSGTAALFVARSLPGYPSLPLWAFCGQAASRQDDPATSS